MKFTLLIFSLIIQAPIALAISYGTVSLEKKVTQADVIVYGTIQGVKKTQNLTQNPFDYYTLNVERGLKGPHQSGTVKFRQQAGIGGVKDYQVNDEVVAFLSKKKDGELEIVGFASDVFLVKEKNRKQVIESAIGHEMKDPSGRVYDLRSFESAVTRLAAGQATEAERKTEVNPANKESAHNHAHQESLTSPNETHSSDQEHVHENTGSDYRTSEVEARVESSDNERGWFHWQNILIAVVILAGLGFFLRK